MSTKTFTLWEDYDIVPTVDQFSNWIAIGDYKAPDGTYGKDWMDRALVSLILPSIVNGTVDIAIQGAFAAVSAEAFALRCTGGPSGTAAEFADKDTAGNSCFTIEGPLPPYIRAKLSPTGASIAGNLDLLLQGISTRTVNGR